MKKTLFLFTILVIFSCSGESENTTEVKDDLSKYPFEFITNIHVSLPNEWATEFDKIMGVLKQLIPVNSTNYFNELPIYAWNSSENMPYQSEIGYATGASISGNGTAVNGKWMVLEIPYQEFDYEAMHRYSVIGHEYYHAYQMSLSKSFFDGNIELKWMSEGSAATFESLYIQQHYSFNYFLDAQNDVNIAAINSPSIFETFDASKDEDPNYASSVFMFLALSKELQKTGLTEPQAFKLILKDYWTKDPTDDNWKEIFEEIFQISVSQFYDNLKSYTNDISTVVPSETLTLEGIFN